METYKQFTDRVNPTINKANALLPFKPTLSSYKEWEADLPLLNTQMTANLLLTAAQGLLSANISARVRFELAEATQTCLLKITSTVIDKTENVKLPLIKELESISFVILNVLSDFHASYIGIICSNDFLNIETSDNKAGAHLFSEQEKGLIIFRAIELLEIQQFIMAMVYKQPQGPFWNNANALFMLAEDLKIHQFDHLNMDQQLVSIENAFKKLHFFHLASTNRFRQTDTQAIRAILAKHANDILLSAAHNEASSFYINLSSTKAILHLEEAFEENTGNRYLNNESLIQFMLSDQVIAKGKHGAISLHIDNPTLPKKTIKQLLSSWSTKQSRQNPRHKQHEEISVYPGFDSIIKALVSKHNPDAYKKKSNNSQANPADFKIDDLHLIPMGEHQQNHHDLNAKEINQVLKATARALKATTHEAHSVDSIWTKHSPDKNAAKGEEVQAEIHDASLKGLLFQVSATNKPLLKASDLIGLQTKEESIQLAIVRQINTLSNNDVSVGVEMMSPKLKIAHIKFHDKKAPPRPVIFLKGIPAINQPDSIISPLLLENIHEDVILKTNHEKHSFSIDRIIDTNQVFTQYSISNNADVD